MAIAIPCYSKDLLPHNLIFLSYTYILIPFYVYALSYRKEQDLKKEIESLDLDIDIEEFEISKEISYAEKTLRLHNNQLQRYYDLNLKENRWVFFLGILCIIAGLVILLSTSFFLINDSHLSDTSQIIIGCLGGIGSILSNFIGALYIKMNTAVSENLKEFHSKLVETHKLLMGNLIAAKIENKDAKDITYSEMAKKVCE